MSKPLSFRRYDARIAAWLITLFAVLLVFASRSAAQDLQLQQKQLTVQMQNSNYQKL